MTRLDHHISDLIIQCFEPIPKPVLLHEPTFGAAEEEHVVQALKDGWVSYAGPDVEKFDRAIAEFCGARFAVSVVNGTAALHAALLVSGIQANDEVLLPTLTFVATANAIAYTGAIPHFIDSHPSTLGVNPKKLRDYLEKHTKQDKQNRCINKTSKRIIKAIIPVHVFGHPCDMQALQKISVDFNIDIIEDAAEALGSYDPRGHVGANARLAVLSFNGNKILTTGGGGAILTNDEDLYKRLKHITTTAKQPHSWKFFHDEIGYNYRLPNINAALGLGQMNRLPDYIQQKRHLFEIYQTLFKNIDEGTLLKEPKQCKSNYWLNCFILDRNYKNHRDRILEQCNDQNIMLRPIWEPMHTLPMFKNCPKMNLDEAESLAQRIINLPSSPFLAELLK